MEYKCKGIDCTKREQCYLFLKDDQGIFSWLNPLEKTDCGFYFPVVRERFIYSLNRKRQLSWMHRAPSELKKTC